MYFDILLALDGSEFNAELVCQGEVMGRTTFDWNCGGTWSLICWKRYSEAPKPPTTRTFWVRAVSGHARYKDAPIFEYEDQEEERSRAYL